MKGGAVGKNRKEIELNKKFVEFWRFTIKSLPI
jgi:hypothetical protein